MTKRSVGFIGLGRMGLNMTRRLVLKGHDVHGYNKTPDAARRAARFGIKTHNSLKELVAALPRKKILWLMVPSGKTVDQVLKQLIPLLSSGDIVVNGGNDFFQDSQRQGALLAKHGIQFIDCGTSGGVAGRKDGFCLMIGGKTPTVRHVEPLFLDLAIKNGYGHFGPSGAGHFVKSVHNIVEYGYLQALGEGMQALKNSPFNIDFKLASQVWANGSVIRSWVVDLAIIALNRPDFKKLKPIITSQTTGELTKTANIAKVKLPVFEASVKARKETTKPLAFSRQFINAIRREFGGHAVVK